VAAQTPPDQDKAAQPSNNVLKEHKNWEVELLKVHQDLEARVSELEIKYGEEAEINAKQR